MSGDGATRGTPAQVDASARIEELENEVRRLRRALRQAETAVDSIGQRLRRALQPDE